MMFYCDRSREERYSSKGYYRFAGSVTLILSKSIAKLRKCNCWRKTNICTTCFSQIDIKVQWQNFHENQTSSIKSYGWKFEIPSTYINKCVSNKSRDFKAITSVVYLNKERNRNNIITRKTHLRVHLPHNACNKTPAWTSDYDEEKKKQTYKTQRLASGTS